MRSSTPVETPEDESADLKRAPLARREWKAVMPLERRPVGRSTPAHPTVSSSIEPSPLLACNPHAPDQPDSRFSSNPYSPSAPLPRNSRLGTGDTSSIRCGYRADQTHYHSTMTKFKAAADLLHEVSHIRQMFRSLDPDSCRACFTSATDSFTCMTIVDRSPSRRSRSGAGPRRLARTVEQYGRTGAPALRATTWSRS